MQAIIPAAGAGTRLRPLTATRPKPLVPIAGTELLGHVFEAGLEAGVSEFIVVVGYRGDQIIDRVGTSVGDTPITYVRQGERRGLGHAVFQARDHTDGTVVVLNGDNIFGGSIRPAIEAVETGADGAVLVEETSLTEARETGVVVTEGDRIQTIVEKPADPPSNLVTTGCYVVPQRIFSVLADAENSATGEIELSEAVGAVAEQDHEIAAVHYSDWRENINRPEDILRAEQKLLHSG